MQILKYLIQLPFYLLSFFVVRNRKIWVIGDRFGLRYDDNSKFLFEYINSIKSDIRIIWITDLKTIQKELKNKGFECFTSNSFKGFYYSLICKIGIVSFSRYDVNSFLMGGATWVNLHHGNTIKKDIDHSSFIPKVKNLLINKVFKFRSSIYDYMVCTNDLENLKNNFSKNFGINKSGFLITGLPRNDYLYKFNYKYPKVKTILYAPSFRVKYINQEYDLFYKYNWNFELINDFLIKNNLILKIRPHPHLKINNEFKNRILNYSNIFFNDPLSNSSQEELIRTDFLITDYSGIYIDFLHLLRPVIFAPFDIKYFKKNEGLSYDYNSITTNYKIKNWSDLLRLDFNKLKFDDSHLNTLNFFERYKDGNNSKRVYKSIRSLVEDI